MEIEKMTVNLATHRILMADYASDGQFEFPIEIAFLTCSFELERLIGTVDAPGTPNGIVPI